MARRRWEVNAGGLIPNSHVQAPEYRPLYLLVFITFFLVIGFRAWNLLSVKRYRKTDGNTTGPAGPNDPKA